MTHLRVGGAMQKSVRKDDGWSGGGDGGTCQAALASPGARLTDSSYRKCQRGCPPLDWVKLLSTETTPTFIIQQRLQD